MTAIELINQLIAAVATFGTDIEVRIRPIEDFGTTRPVAKIKMVGMTVAICEDPKS